MLPFEVLNLVILSLFVIGGYLRRLGEVYSKSYRKSRIPMLLLLAFRRYRPLEKIHIRLETRRRIWLALQLDDLRNTISQPGKVVFEPRNRVVRLLEYCPCLETRDIDWFERRQRQFERRKARIPTRLLLAIISARIVADELSHGFLIEIIWLSFYFTLGMAHLMPKIATFPEAAQATPNFGQLVPLFLLALPFMSASEMFAGKYGQSSEGYRAVYAY